jgi:hypothetical protein
LPQDTKNFKEATSIKNETSSPRKRGSSDFGFSAAQVQSRWVPAFAGMTNLGVKALQ